MKNIIEKSGMKLKEFSEKFEIPYNTVSQWYRGERNAPQWVKNLIEEKLFGQTPLEKINSINEPDLIIHEYYTDEERKYRAFLYQKNLKEEDIIWFNRCQEKFKDIEEGINKKVIYKAYKI